MELVSSNSETVPRKAILKFNLNDILLNVDLMNKDFWPFRYFGKDHIDMKFFSKSLKMF